MGIRRDGTGPVIRLERRLIYDAAGWGKAAVLKTTGGGRLEVVAELASEDWQRLAGAFGQRSD